MCVHSFLPLSHPSHHHHHHHHHVEEWLDGKWVVSFWKERFMVFRVCNYKFYLISLVWLNLSYHLLADWKMLYHLLLSIFVFSLFHVLRQWFIFSWFKKKSTLNKFKKNKKQKKQQQRPLDWEPSVLTTRSLNIFGKIVLHFLVMGVQ